jgi:hypothetical protein
MTMTKKLVISLIVTFVVLIGEIVGGIISNSLALLSDAGHVFTDVFSLGMSLLAILIMKKPADKRATYGYHRTGIQRCRWNAQIVEQTDYIASPAHRLRERRITIIDDIVKSPQTVIPAKAGIQNYLKTLYIC